MKSSIIKKYYYSSPKFFYVDHIQASRETIGPITFEDLNLLYTEGKITTSSLIFEEGSRWGWREYGELYPEINSLRNQEKGELDNIHIKYFFLTALCFIFSIIIVSQLNKFIFLWAVLPLSLLGTIFHATKYYIFGRENKLPLWGSGGSGGGSGDGGGGGSGDGGGCGCGGGE